MNESNPQPLAIVGMACLLPQSPNLATYWRNIVDAKDCLTDIPEDHSWSPKDYYSEDSKAPEKTWATRGGFINKVPFDPMENGVIPVALEAIDSDQLLALIVARECLKDAGIQPDADDWNREKVACILGHTSTSELVVDLSARLHGPVWEKAMKRCGVNEDVAEQVVQDINQHFPSWQEQSFPGMLANVVSGRIANRLDLGGTNATVDAACASSLAALQYAVSEVQSGNADIAITGGSDTLNDIFMYMCFSKTPALSKSGDARPFDVDSDGIIISEGIAMVAIKRLADAERDGDKIYALIKGIGTSSDGKNKSIYAPNSAGQSKAIRRAYAQANFPLETIELIEAHGTGTKAGDMAEFTGLQEVFSESTRTGNHVALGSVKSQIGHTKATAGTAGLMKAVLALHHKTLPPTAKITKPNPAMPFEDGPLYLNTVARPWIRGGEHPRRAGVSAFGFGGTNYHIALEEYVKEAPVLLPALEELFLLGADNANELKASLNALLEGQWDTVAHASRSTLERWRPSPYVLSFTANDLQDLSTRGTTALSLLKEGKDASEGGVHYGTNLSAPKVAILFPGQGSQTVNMGRTMALRNPVFRSAVDRAAQALNSQGRPGLGEVIYPPPAFDNETESEQQQTLTATQWAQPAIGAVSKGLYDVLTDYGVTADAFAGHSYGELVALCAAGVLSEDDLWTASRVRGESMAVNGADRGTMAAVSAPLEEIQLVLNTLSDSVVLANRNHPRQGVISGSREGIATAVAAMQEAGFSAREIPVSAAFHSSLVADAKLPFSKTLETLEFGEAHTPVYANTTAQPYPAEADGCRELLANQIVSPVDFVGITESLVSAGIQVFLECGPKGVLSGLLKRCLKTAPGTHILSVDAKSTKVDGDIQLKQLLAKLAVLGVPLSAAPLLREEQPPNTRREGSKATVMLGGANYKRPETLAPPAPKLPVRPPQASASPMPRAVLPQESRPNASPQTRAPDNQSKASPAASRPLSGVHAPKSIEPQRMDRMNNDALSALLDATRQSLVAFQQTQEQTASVHAQFLQAHAKANENFATLFQAHQQLVSSALGRDVLPLPKVTPTLQTPDAVVAPQSVDRDALMSTVLSPSDVNYSRLQLPSRERANAAPAHDQFPVMRASTLSELLKSGGPLPTKATTPQHTPSVSHVNVTEILLMTIAEKTGYPTELLQLDMSLESDLGIDSIKRVEIMAALQDNIAGVGELDAETVGHLRTLGEVKEVLESALGLPAQESAPSVDVTQLLISIIAEKTGYPAELIQPQMDLESELGIDSIKRVEILSALQEGIEQAGELEAEVFGGLRTVQEIIDQVNERLPQGPTPETQAPRQDLHALVTQLIGDRTGYPVDLLNAEMNLESDLGIDSIKRVEILSAIQEALPSLPDIDEESYATARTIGEIVALLEQANGTTTNGTTTNGTTTNGTGTTPSSVSLDENTHIPARREVSVRPALRGVSVSLPSPLLITKDQKGIAEPLAELLKSHVDVVDVLDLDWNEENPSAQLESSYAGVIHAAALGNTGEPLHRILRGGFELAKALPEATFFAGLTGLGGSFGHERFNGDAIQGALPGLLKTLAQERTHTRCLALDIDLETSTIEAIAQELCTDRGAIEVGLSDEPLTLHAEPVSIHPDTLETRPVEPGDLIVVSGGARGVTASVVHEVATRWRPSFLLLGRSELPATDPAWANGCDDAHLTTTRISFLQESGQSFKPATVKKDVEKILQGREMRENIHKLERLGVHVSYKAVDVRNPETVKDAVAESVSTLGPVRGVIHAAGVIADKLIDEKTLEQFDFVYGTKVEGFTNLLASVSIEDLRLLAVFSSVAGRYGNRGQVDYAMANEAITHLAHQYAGTPQLNVKAFHWGPWAGGMVNPALQSALEKRGMKLIPLEQGAQQFCAEFERGGPAVEVVIGGPDSAQGLHAPETHSVVKRAPLAAGSKVVELTGQQGFLDDHRIGGKPVLPFVMALEWMVEAARESHPQYHVAGVRALAVLKGVVLDQEQKALKLEWNPAESTGDLASLEFRLLGDQGPLGLPVVHYSGIVDLSTQPIQTNRFPGSNGLGKAKYPYSVKEAYDRFLFHGPGLQGITDIVGMSDHGIVGTLEPSRPKQLGVDKSLWQTDPVALDSALQLVGLWVREVRGASALPCFVEEYRQYAPFRSKVTCHIEMEPTKTAKGRFQATFVDPHGRVVAAVHGGQYAFQKGLNESFKMSTERPN